MSMGEDKLLDSLKRVTIELKATRERLRAVEERQSEPIAIVGMSCRLPREVDSPEDFWRMLSEGEDGIGPTPEDRGWPDGSELGGPMVREGGFVAGAAEFDAAFFGVHPAEATRMDPQQRLLLEAAWVGLEDAGLDPRALRGSNTGIYAGAIYQDYGANPASADLEEVGMAAGSIVSGRVAYALDLKGPAVTVDTACSSSLVALHLACQALRGGECELAMAGGVTVLATPLVFRLMAEVSGLDASGRCKSFDAAADGTGFGEGVGLLVLERLSDAEAKGHRPLALIRGSAINQDGASNGLTAPNGPSQERVIRQALADAGLSPADVDAVEAHGTATMLGDPIEANALLATYGQERGDAGPLFLGSVKSNIGHTQGAAGVAGVIKMALALRHGLLPATLHLSEPTPHVDWSSGEVELLAEPRAWERGERVRRAGISSFGISGTNAHLIIEEAPPAQPVVEGESGDGPADRPAPLLLSAKSEPALRAAAGRLAIHLRENPEQAPAEVARSLVEGRSFHEHRGSVCGAGREELMEGLTALAEERESEYAYAAPAPAASAPAAPVFLFPGQGSQWRSMALELLESSPRFVRVIDECEQALEPHVDWSLSALLRRQEGTPDLERIDVVQPTLFAMSAALASMWRAEGVEPAAVVGHSQGEIAAAYVAGGLSLEDAAGLIARRSQVLVRGAGEGGMALVASSPEALSERVPRWQELVSLAGINSPSLIVLSGPTDGIEEALRLCEEAGIWTRRIKAAIGAGHSPAVERGRSLLLEAAAGISPGSGEIPFFSSVTAGELDTADLDAEYWYRNAREPVLFGPAISRLLTEGHRRFIEVSPNPILAFPVHEVFGSELGKSKEKASFTPTLRHRHGGLADFALAVGSAWANGVEIDLDAAVPPARRVPVPTYPFQRRRFWLEQRQAAAAPSAALPADEPEEAAEASFAERLTTVSQGEREAMVLEFVMRQLAASLGYESFARFDPGRPFLELGFDSLTALQYRNRINRATGLDLAISVALDYPTPQALAGFVLSQLQVGGEARRREEGTLQPLLRNAMELGRIDEFAALLQDLAGFRPSFVSVEEVPSPVRLADQAAGPPLVCIPSIVPNGGPHEYAKLAAALADRHPVSSLSWPGFTSMEPVPADAAVAVELQATAVEAATDAEPAVLLGHSSGGPFAYAVARELERRGTRAAAVVMLDSYHPGQVAFDTESDGRSRSIRLAIFGQLLADQGPEAAPGDTRLSAAMSYLRLLGQLQIEPPSVPILLLRAAEPIAPAKEFADWRPEWDVPHDALETAGNHLTMMDEHASATAEAVSDWLAGAVDIRETENAEREVQR
jgi:acyl transferase domain-containing protein/pimeloyl-ACP methyl ester carboxylesterase